MQVSKIAAASNLYATGTAVARLAAVTGLNRQARHDLIVETVGTIIALALCAQPPKGHGDAADHSKVAGIFTAAKMDKYADACIGLAVALKVKGFRSVADWETAELEGFAMADSMLADLRPKSYTAAELAKREKARAEKKAQKEAETKAEAQKAEEKAKADAIAADAKAYERGVADASKAETIVALIKTGQFKAEEVAAIMAACQSVTETAAA